MRSPSYSNKQIKLYSDADYDDVIRKLPDIIKRAERKAIQVLEPKWDERQAIISIIKDFIRKQNRIVYGGSAIDAAIKIINPNDGIYDEYSSHDIEFYSPKPVVDLVELCDILYQKGYQYVKGKEAQHNETFSIYVNFQLYCDITYVPTAIFHKIRTFEDNGIRYTHPHFIFIDQLRIINQPLTAASQRWEKTFKRMHKLLSYYPFLYYGSRHTIPNPDPVSKKIINDIKYDFLKKNEIGSRMLITGYDAFRFYCQYVRQESNSRNSPSNTKNNQIIPVPYLEFVTAEYIDVVKQLYQYLQSVVPDSTLLTIEERYPFFQFLGNSICFKYDDHTIVIVYDSRNFCIPYYQVEYDTYVSYQYLLMNLLMFKFRAYVNNDKELYHNYTYLANELIICRNHFLHNKNVSVINNSPFGEFKIGCVGNAVSYLRESLLRKTKERISGKREFQYFPEKFADSETKLNTERYNFGNSSGNKINSVFNLVFWINDDGELVQNDKSFHQKSDEETESDSPREDDDSSQLSSETSQTDDTN